MTEEMRFAIGLVLGLLASVPIGFAIVSRTRHQRAERSESVQRINGELVTDERLAIPKADYLASVKALGDKMASPDPKMRELAALAYDAFLETVKPS